MRYRTSGLTIGLMALCGVASAQTITDFTLTDGSATYSERNLIGANNRADGGLADFSIGGGVDNMFQNWWWYHADDSPRDASLGEQVYGEASGNHARIVYVQNTTPNLQDSIQFDIEYTLTELSSTEALVQITWKVQNLAAVGQNISFFSYADYDLGGTPGNDSGVFVAPNQFSITDGDYQASYLASASGLVAAEQAAYPSILNRLTDGDRDDLVNGPSNFGPGDWTGGFQWNFALGANGAPNGGDQFVGTVLKTVAVPEPASMLALVVGIGGIVARRRKR